MIVAFAFCYVTTALAAGDEKNGHAYFKKSELPDMTKILPPSPLSSRHASLLTSHSISGVS